MFWKALITGLSLLVIQGCGTTMFADPAVNPVIEDKVGKWGNETVGTLAVKADRRIVVVRLEPDAKFCAEPPPDVAENITKKLILELEAQVKQQGGKVKLDDSLITQIQALVSRTQGVDIYRTGMYGLCQHFLNGGLTASELKESSGQLLATAKELILKELELNANTQTVKAQAAIFAKGKEGESKN